MTSTAVLRTKTGLLGALLTCVLMVPFVAVSQLLAPVNLGSTSNFAILAGSLVSNISTSVITGDIGLIPTSGSNITGLLAEEVAGTIFTVDSSGPDGSVMESAILTTAKNDLTTAYNDAAGRLPVPSGPFLDPGSGNIGGLTLGPGLYKFTGTASITGSDVTLTGSATDVWIFQIADDLIVGNSIHVVLADGAQPENIFWQLGTSAVIGTNSVVMGTILADQSISLNSGATIEGRLLSSNAAVSLTSNTVIKPPKVYPNPATVNLLTAGDFRILAGSAVTIGSSTIITGDVGTSPGSTVTNNGTVTGTMHLNDAAAIQAQNDLTAVYNNVAGRTSDARLPTKLGGRTMGRGVYASTPGAFEIAGTLTLDGTASDVFIFKMASTLTTEMSSSVILAGGALASNVFWQVGSSATLDGNFKGNILASVSITQNSGASIEGRALARNSFVTVNGNLVLPVELVAFTVTAINANAYLCWTTASEVNNYGFEIERRQFAIWENAGFVGGAGTSNVPRNYSFIDKNLSSGRYAYRLKQIDNTGACSYQGSAEVEIGILPQAFTLLQNYPNPFNPTTAISYQLSAVGPVRLRVFDILGRDVAELANEVQPAGSHSVTWDASGTSSGVYFYRLETGSFVSTKKLILSE